MKWIIALATAGVLVAGYACATSTSNVGTPSVDRAVVEAAHTVDQQPAQPTPQAASTAVEGHATGLGSSTPQTIGQPGSSQPTGNTGAPAGPRPPCPRGHPLGIACIAP